MIWTEKLSDKFHKKPLNVFLRKVIQEQLSNFIRPLQQPYPQSVNKYANYKNTCNTQNRMQIDPVRSIPSDIVQDIFPQPFPHRITIGMNQQDAKSAAANCIDQLAMPYLQILEIHKRT